MPTCRVGSSGPFDSRRTYDPGVGPLLLAVAGVLALGVAAAILRSFGPRYRVGRLLAVAPLVSVAEAVRIAEAGEAALRPGRRPHRQRGRVRGRATTGRSSCAGRRSRWRPAAGAGGRVDDRCDVGDPTSGRAFVVREGLDEIGVDAAAACRGPRRGAADEHGPASATSASGRRRASRRTPTRRLTVEQVSSVEHATVAGVPAPRARWTASSSGAGLGRPLLLTTLERDEAMRVLTGGATRPARLAIACLVAGAVLLRRRRAVVPRRRAPGRRRAVALAASPDPTLRPGGDTRTPGSRSRLRRRAAARDPRRARARRRQRPRDPRVCPRSAAAAGTARPGRHGSR